MKKAILFDFDGTLANTAPGIVATLAETLRRMQKPIPTDEDARQTIGLPLRDALQRLGRLTDDEADMARDTYTDLFMTIEVNNISLFPDVEQTLQQLVAKGLRMAIVTSRDKASLDVVLSRYGLTAYFEQTITCDDHLTPKPAPDMVNELLHRMQLQPTDVLVMGDTTYDIDMGNAAHADTIAITYGNHTRQQLDASHPTHIVDHFHDILTLV